MVILIFECFCPMVYIPVMWESTSESCASCLILSLSTLKRIIWIWCPLSFKKAAFQAQICIKYDPWMSPNWIFTLLMNSYQISIPTVKKSLPRGAHSIWPSIITSQLEKHVGSNWLLSFCTWYESTASKPLYPVTVHKFFSLYWLTLSIFLIRKGAIKIH